ncbi:hypothetical protein VE23_15420 [Paenibacillus sp. D9]|nr:hypothetical protein VE23_15420 [Paenibacillus sp. D9]
MESDNQQRIAFAPIFILTDRQLQSRLQHPFFLQGNPHRVDEKQQLAQHLSERPVRNASWPFRQCLIKPFQQGFPLIRFRRRDRNHAMMLLSDRHLAILLGVRPLGYVSSSSRLIRHAINPLDY